MSAPLDVAAQETTLDLLFGSGTPAAFEVALFNGDPANGGVEMDFTGGYARVVIDNDGTTFPGASGNATQSIVVNFAAPSGPWLAGGLLVPATHFALYDAADSVTGYYPGELGTQITIYGTEPTVAVRVTGFWDTQSET